jgi:hypothetical protein
MKRHTKKTPSFLLARWSLYLAGAASALFGVVGWLDKSDPVSVALMVFTGLSALVVPLTIEIVGRDRWSVLLLAPAVIFGGINAYSFHHAVEALIETPRREAHYTSAVQPLETILSDARAVTKAASAAVSAHSAPVIPDTMGPKNIAARMDLWERAHKPLTDALALAQAAEVKAEATLKAAPAYEPLASNELVWVLALALDISLAAGLAGIANTSASIEARARKERLAQKAAKAKAARKTAPKQKTFPKPRVVVSN